jgi:hypothetical protein
MQNAYEKCPEDPRLTRRVIEMKIRRLIPPGVIASVQLGSKQAGLERGEQSRSLLSFKKRKSAMTSTHEHTIDSIRISTAHPQHGLV